MKNKKIILILLYIFLFILLSLTIYFIIHGTIKTMHYLEKYDNYINNKSTVKKPNKNSVRIYLIMIVLFSSLTILSSYITFTLKNFNVEIKMNDKREEEVEKSQNTRNNSALNEENNEIEEVEEVKKAI